MNSTISRGLICGLIVFSASCWSLPALEVVKDRQPRVLIVSSAGAASAPEARNTGKRKNVRESESDEALAVRVLQEWIKKITDVELPITKSPPANSPAIFVGKAAIEAGLVLRDLNSPTREGLRIMADDKRILIAGQSEAATLKAVCRFLEELGCRYFMDGEIGEVFPRTSTLSVRPLQITEKPKLLYRNPKGPTWNARLWKAWNGAGGETFHHEHAWGNYVKQSLFAEHPDFFAMGPDGQRKPSQWLCTSNKELRRYFANAVIEAVGKGIKNPSLSPTDGRGYCQCPACKAQDDPKLIEPSSGMVSIATRYLDFFDDVARQVSQACPDSILSFYCYADYTQPPTLNRPLSSNLCAVIAPIRYCRLHELGHAGCSSREQQVRMLEGWAKIANHLGYYNYLYNLADGTLPFFKFAPCKKEFPVLAEKGLCAMTIEVLSNWHIYGPQIYLSLRLSYDPTADADAIMEDYWEKFYGKKAAPYMKQYWMGIDAEVEKLQSHAGSFFGLQQIYTPKFLAQCQSALRSAAEAVKGEAPYEARVALHTEGFQNAADYQLLGAAMNSGDTLKARNIYELMLARLRKLADKGWANREYATAYLERYVSAPLKAAVTASTPPNKLIQVLPDKWRFALDEDNRGAEKGWQTADFNDNQWTLVSTEKTLDAQGFDKTTHLWYRMKFPAPQNTNSLFLLFMEVDGVPEVYVNGRAAELTLAESSNPVAREKTATPARIKPRTPFRADVTKLISTGENVLAVHVDHSKITELALGGILRPVLLVQKAK